MMEFLRLLGQIALLRRGPQDVPASPFLLAFTVAACFAVNCLVSLLLPPSPGPWLLYLAVGVVFTLAWYVVLLRVTAKPERFLQTATAIFGYQAILSPLAMASASLLQRFQTNTQSGLLLPILILAIGICCWYVAAGAHIVKAALEWTLLPSVMIVIAQIVSVELLLLVIFQPPT